VRHSPSSVITLAIAFPLNSDRRCFCSVSDSHLLAVQTQGHWVVSVDQGKLTRRQRCFHPFFASASAATLALNRRLSRIQRCLLPRPLRLLWGDRMLAVPEPVTDVRDKFRILLDQTSGTRTLVYLKCSTGFCFPPVHLLGIAGQGQRWFWEPSRCFLCKEL